MWKYKKEESRLLSSCHLTSPSAPLVPAHTVLKGNHRKKTHDVLKLLWETGEACLEISAGTSRDLCWALP